MNWDLQNDMIAEYVALAVVLLLIYVTTVTYPIIMLAASGIVVLFAIEQYVRVHRFEDVTLGSKRVFFVPGRGFRKMLVVRSGYNFYWYDGKWVVRQNRINGLMLWKSKEEYKDKVYDKMIKKDKLELKDVAYLNLHEMDVMKYGR